MQLWRLFGRLCRPNIPLSFLLSSYMRYLQAHIPLIIKILFSSLNPTTRSPGLLVFLTIICAFFLCAFPSHALSGGTPVHSNSVWALCYFSHSVYILFVASAILYLLPNVADFSQANTFSRGGSFTSLEGQDLLKLVLTPLLLVFILHTTWSGPSLTAWFGHVVFSNFQFKITYVMYFFFASFLLGLSSTAHYSSMGSYDFTLVTLNFFFWVWLTFFSNNFFTFIFFIELLSASITLLLVTSTFSSSHFYNNVSYSKHSYFHTSTPTAFLQTLLFFFWVTLVSSLALFLFLLIFYFKMLSFDWNLTDVVFLYLLQVSSITHIFSISFSWLLLLICIFIKCGTVPFYFWKPTFFKGMTLTSLFFYVYIYYFGIFFYFTYVIFFYLNELFFFNLYIIVALVLVATLGLSVLLYESFYVKSFLALSSILNSVFIFFALCSHQSSDVLFLL